MRRFLVCIPLLVQVRAQLSPLITYSFSSSTEQTLSGTSATTCSYSPVQQLSSSAVVADIALLKGAHSDGRCYPQPAYSDTNFKIEYGSLTASDGRTFIAYRISPPATKASSFAAGGNEVYYKSSSTGSVDIYTFDGSGFTKVATKTTQTNVFIATGVLANAFSVAHVVLFDSSEARLSAWPIIAQGVEGALLQSSSDFTLAALRFDVSGQPFDPATDWDSKGDGAKGPGTWQARYGLPKKFFPMARNDGSEGVVWQDLTSRKVYMTWLGANFCSSTTSQISQNSNTDNLIAAASDGTSIIFFQLGDGATDKTAGTTLIGYKLDCTTGTQLVSKTYPTGKTGMNIYAFSNSGASIFWNTATNRVFLVIARTFTRSSDGLNHQGETPFLIDSSTLNLVKTYGQTASHSWGNSVLLASDSTYLGMSLGDNYPRGIKLWRFNEASSSSSRLVYNFKTQHQTSSSCCGLNTNYPIYTEISGGGTTYYKWSNDNNVYTELAHRGVIEVSDGLLVFFVGEDPPLDNSEVGALMNKPRNLGFVKWPKALSSSDPLSSGGAETGGFYTFGGTWVTQTNKGVQFITRHSSVDSCVSRPKTALVSDDSIVLLFEIWTSLSYVKTQAMLVDKNGAVSKQAFDVTHALRLPFTDELMVSNGKVIAYAGKEGRLIRYEMCIGSSCSSSTNAGSTCGQTTSTSARTTITTTTTTVTTTTTKTTTTSMTTTIPTTTSTKLTTSTSTSKTTTGGTTSTTSVLTTTAAAMTTTAGVVKTTRDSMTPTSGSVTTTLGVETTTISAGATTTSVVTATRGLSSTAGVATTTGIVTTTTGSTILVSSSIPTTIPFATSTSEGVDLGTTIAASSTHRSSSTSYHAATTTVEISIYVYGSLDLQIASAADFFEDMVAQDAVKAGIAEAAGIAQTYVTLTFTQLSRRLEPSLGGYRRRLTDTVQASYTISIPASVDITGNTVQSNLVTASNNINSIVSQKVRDAKGAEYSFRVVAMSDVQQATAVPTTATTTTADGGQAIFGIVNTSIRKISWPYICLVTIALYFE